MAAPKLPPAVEQQIIQLQQLENTIRAIQIQLDQLNRQKSELNAAIKTLETLPEDEMVYKSVGAILVHDKAKNVLTEFKDKQEMIELQMKSLEKQMQSSQQKMEELRQKLTTFLQQAGSGTFPS